MKITKGQVFSGVAALGSAFVMGAANAAYTVPEALTTAMSDAGTAGTTIITSATPYVAAVALGWLGLKGFKKIMGKIL